MLYVGMDVHKSFSRIATFDPATGEMRDLGNVPSHWEHLQAELEHLEGEKTVVLEAGRNSHFLAARLEAVADQVWVIDPAALRKLVARGSKTDARDAEGLARWAAAGALKPVWRPSAESLKLRELTRGKQTVTGMQAQVRNQIRALLARNGVEIGKGKDLLSDGVQQFLNEVSGKLHPYARQLLEMWRAILTVVVTQAKGLDPAVEREAKAHPQARRLQSLPGVGWYLGLVMAVEIDDVSRFSEPAKLRAYSGLCPSVHQTGGRTVYGPLTKRGNRYLRCAAGLAAQGASKRKDLEPRLRRLHTRAAYRHGRNPAKMELARALLTLAHHLLTREELYCPREVSA